MMEVFKLLQIYLIRLYHAKLIKQHTILVKCSTEIFALALPKHVEKQVAAKPKLPTRAETFCKAPVDMFCASKFGKVE